MRDHRTGQPNRTIYPQVGVLGDTSFDLSGTPKLTVRWFVVGYGTYKLQPEGDLRNYAVPNRAVDIYLDE